MHFQYEPFGRCSPFLRYTFQGRHPTRRERLQRRDEARRGASGTPPEALRAAGSSADPGSQCVQPKLAAAISALSAGAPTMGRASHPSLSRWWEGVAYLGGTWEAHGKCMRRCGESGSGGTQNKHDDTSIHYIMYKHIFSYLNPMRHMGIIRIQTKACELQMERNIPQPPPAFLAPPPALSHVILYSQHRSGSLCCL